jgi:hypothetical protein
LDGAQLTEHMHEHGINMRYLGAVASLLRARVGAPAAAASAADLDRFASYAEACVAQDAVRHALIGLCEEEMVARAAKHWLGSGMVAMHACELRVCACG